MLTAVVLTLLLAQPSPRVFLWDYSTADLTTGSVNRFELRLDGGAWKDVGRTAHVDQGGVPSGSVAYEAPVPPLTVGNHTVEVRACNVQECSEPSVLAFVISVTPARVNSLRIGGGK